MRVIATKTGYDGTKVRDPGEEFEMPKGSTGSWFEPLADAPKAKAKAEGTGRPTTVGALAKEQGEALA